jgi:type I restriction enzyme S subunit
MVALAEVAEISGGITKNAKRSALPIQRPYLSVANVHFNRIDTNNLSNIGVNEAELARAQLMPGDLMVVEGNGSLSQLGRVAIWHGQVSGCLHQNHLIKVRPKPTVKSKWLLYWLMSSAGREAIEATASSTSGLHTLSLSKVGSLPAPIASLKEQEAAIAYIDLHLSRLDEAVTTLQGIQAKLKQARASILKAAVEGRLVETEAELARRNATDYENAEALLQRSLAEKKRLFQEAQLQEGKRKTWKEPSRPECHETSSKPEGWSITSMEQIADVSGGLAKDSKITSGESLPYLRVANVQRGKLDLEHIKTITCPSEKVYGLLLKKGDVLLNEGGDRDKLGRGWVWNGEIPRCIHQNHVFKARLALPAIQPRFISHYCNTLGESYFQNEGKQTTNLASISLSKVRALPISLPPASEQLRILEEIDRRFTVLDQVEATVTASLARCDKLRQAILKRAFEARLVPAA